MPITAVEVHLRVNPVACDAFGYCAELLPELVSLDEWGYPVIAAGPVPRHLADLAQRAMRECPRRALIPRAGVVDGTLIRDARRLGRAAARAQMRMRTSDPTRRTAEG